MGKKERILTIFLSLMLIFIVGCSTEKDAQADENESLICKAKVLSVKVSEVPYSDSDDVYTEQILKVQPVEGLYKGQVFETEVSLGTPNNQNISPYRKGDTVELEIYPDENGGVGSVDIRTLIRAPYVIALVVVFLLLVGAVGRIKGIKTILSLTFTVGAVVLLLVPALASGKDPIFFTILISILIAVFSLFVIGGVNRKTLSAILGTIGGLACAGLITLLANSLIRVSAIELEDVEMLVVSNTGFIFNLPGLITSGILISCLGAVMDISTSISSVVNEVSEVNPSLASKQLFASGMAVGRDVMGTMANTLILAYTGGTLMLMVVWSVYGVSFMDMLNMGYIVVEVVKIICGSIGMILTIPLTSWIASRLIRKPETTGQKTGSMV